MTKNVECKTYIDLFAGCGGLSLGLEVSGFSLALAVEKSPMAAETFFHNFIDENEDHWRDFCLQPLEKQFESKLVVQELKILLDNPKLIRFLRDQEIDLVAGGPPCQGFSMAGLRNPKDQRNQLPYEFLEFVRRVRPKMVLMENVVGITRDFKRKGAIAAPFEELASAISLRYGTNPGYVVQKVLLNAQDYGVPQHRPRMLLLGIRKDLVANPVSLADDGIWRSDKMQIFNPRLAPQPKIRLAHERKSASNALEDIGANGYNRKKRLNDFVFTMRMDPDWVPPTLKSASISRNRTLTNHVLRNHGPRTIKKYRLYHFLSELGIPRDAIASDPRNKDQSRIASTDYQELRQTCIDRYREKVSECQLTDTPFPHWTDVDGKILSGTVNQFLKELEEMHTRKHSQRVLDPKKPAPTILGSPDDHIHFAEPRVMTVRELARLQSFPDSFEFKSKETTGGLRRRFEVPQYTQVGNAVPPLLAKAIGDHLMSLLKEIDGRGQLQ